MISRHKAPLSEKGCHTRAKMMVAEAKASCNVIHGRPHLITVFSQAFCKVLDRQASPGSRNLFLAERQRVGVDGRLACSRACD